MGFTLFPGRKTTDELESANLTLSPKNPHLTYSGGRVKAKEFARLFNKLEDEDTLTITFPNEEEVTLVLSGEWLFFGLRKHEGEEK